ncbi:MAG: DNA polymerase III subunit delta [Spirochaetales bacterium]|uniref:DNA polymerase III subunit delta n=1 Tax=Bullifex sp. TaxID=2815808 RepID=UPI002A50A20C|nr:DNA polymerase III subunit delta [Bullifex sp.]MDD5972481.1 DNA polymerase III subunit delta [Spirochaetales bacterium]MDD7271857.1 DNA polymerase III subunit delta [Spirochaetales bacterium]MDY4066975.1 DNA polymerase III subunit delta [Bullifex sp.]
MSEAYLLFGPEEGKKQDWIIEKKKEILSLHPDSEVVLLFTFETDAETLADALSSSSLFSSYKLVFLKNFDDVKKGPLLNELIKYLKKDEEDSVLIITSNEVSSKKFPTELTSLIKKENLIAFYEMKEDEKKYYVTNLFRREGFKITPEATTMILSLVENNTLEIRTFCYPVIDYFAKKDEKIIDEEDVSKFLAHTREETPQTLFAHIANCDLQGAEASLAKILTTRSDGAIATLSALGKSFRMLEDLHVQVKTNTLFNAFKQVGSLKTSPFDFKGIFNPNDQATYSKALKKYSEKDCDEIIRYLEMMDAEVRKAPQEMVKTILECMLYTIIINKGKQTTIKLERELMDDSFSYI